MNNPPALAPAAARPGPAPAQTVALFMFDFARTGVVANAVRLANALAARGYRVILLVCRAEGQAAHRLDPAVKVIEARGIAAGRLPRGMALLASVPALRRALRRLAPDILLSAGNHAHGAAMAAAAGLPRLRRVLRISNDLDHPGNGPLTRLLRRLVHTAVLGQADQLVLVSAHLARHPLLASALAERRAVIAANGIAVDEVRRLAAMPVAHPWLGDAVPVVVAVGRLVRHKNFATLIRAFAQAAATQPMRLLIIGGGAQAERRRLENLAAALGVAEVVRLEGELANPLPLVAGSATFVLPSLWEGASNALLEALACNVPVVAARSAGNAQEVLGYGRFGLLVDPLDVAGMAQAILYQTSVGACRPAGRANEFSAVAALARACNAVIDLPGRDAPGRRAAALPESA
jgi:glycosyltransferase involved in cell wall biosynthesis